MKDTVVVALLVVAFALVITTHVALALGLAKRQPRWRGAVALVVPPLAPYWGWQEHMRKRVALWAGGLLLYVIMLVLASRV
ncbi:MAG: hypothetical protein KIS78_31140 [Labilithrix sp.]|nr:hypothetical protein [Labilithrix sp.]MCW5836890.1 hypothetical protein [Labilithrix sp.]